MYKFGGNSDGFGATWEKLFIKLLHFTGAAGKIHLNRRIPSTARCVGALGCVGTFGCASSLGRSFSGIGAFGCGGTFGGTSRLGGTGALGCAGSRRGVGTLGGGWRLTSLRRGCVDSAHGLPYKTGGIMSFVSANPAPAVLKHYAQANSFKKLIDVHIGWVRGGIHYVNELKHKFGQYRRRLRCTFYNSLFRVHMVCHNSLMLKCNA